MIDKPAKMEGRSLVMFLRAKEYLLMDRWLYSLQEKDIICLMVILIDNSTKKKLLSRLQKHLLIQAT